MLKKILLLSAALLFVSAGAAAAQDAYPPGGNTITTNDATVAPGGAMVLGIQVCRPGTSASFALDGSTALGTATATNSGVATLNATIPSSTAPGSHAINGSCTGSNGQPLALVLSFTVTGGTGAGNLPTTGSSSTTPMTEIAVAAIAGGGLLVLLANRRRSAHRTEARETAGV